MGRSASPQGLTPDASLGACFCCHNHHGGARVESCGATRWYLRYSYDVGPGICIVAPACGVLIEPQHPATDPAAQLRRAAIAGVHHEQRLVDRRGYLVGFLVVFLTLVSYVWLADRNSVGPTPRETLKRTVLSRPLMRGYLG
jgi:hypothetical protein